MFRQSAARTLRQARGSFAARRSASTVSETASKVKDAAADLSPAHHKPSSDIPWALGSLLVFAPTLFWMTSPPSGQKPHAPAAKDKFKPHLRIPDPNAAHYKIPENVSEEPTENDEELQGLAEENADAADKQASPEPAEDSSNHAASSGLKGSSEKFNAAAVGSQQANQIGGGAAAQNPKAVVEAARASKEDGSDESSPVPSAPESTGDNVAESITDKQDEVEEPKEEEKSEE